MKKREVRKAGACNPHHNSSADIAATWRYQLTGQRPRACKQKQLSQQEATNCMQRLPMAPDLRQRTRAVKEAT